VDYMHREALETLPRVLEALRVDEPILIGHSDGASISIIYAGSGRQPVRGLVLMAPHVFVEDITVAAIARAKSAFESADLAVRLGRYHDDPLGAFRGWSDVWLRREFRTWNIEAFLPHIVAPVLLIQGEDDPYGTLMQIKAVERQIAGSAQTVVLSKCAHSPHADQVGATLLAISAFVESLKR